MATDFIPRRESELVTWTNTFEAGITAIGTTVGLTSAQVTAFGTLNTAWTSAYATANAEVTRTRPNLILKDQAKVNVVANARLLAGMIQKFPATTDAQRAQLGLTVPAERTPIPAPGVSPVMRVKKVEQNIVTLDILDPTSGRRVKPAGVDSVTIFSFIGAAPPSEINLWKFEGSTTSMRVAVAFPTSAEPFSQIWLTSFYTNPRGNSGLACTPITTNLGAWLVDPQSAQQEPLDMKQAA